MKVLVVCQYYYPEPFRIVDICESLVEMGHEVTVLTGLPNYPEGKVLKEYKNVKKRFEILNGVEIIRCFEIGRGNSKVKLFLNYFSYMISASLKALRLNNDFDVVLVNQLSPVMMAVPAIIYKKKNKKKLITYCLDLWPESLSAGGIKEKSLIYRIFYRISKKIYNSSDKILVSSSMFENYFREYLKINNIEINYLPQYAEDIFIKDQISKKKIDNFKVNKEVFNFMFAGNIGEVQSVDTIIKAAEILKNNTNIYFHIVGDGSKFEVCKSMVEGLELNNVIFYGRRSVSEMPIFYNMADAMIVSLKNNKVLSYTLPGKVQSYMAAGKPIIGVVNGESKRIIEEAKCGLVCEAENYIELANIINEFCNMNKKEEMSQNSRKYYCNNYSKKCFFEKLESILRKVEG
ncbi:glycosyltransferase family 4 protein [Clostridium tertium]|uniref:glycosyltransferase family 4 protein n=1 Tax=Clostridium tertium TaxID=1559 RepID=UPI00233055C9|nr:glycosyltransferase family 4 protein [Clostridium tertium]MDB1944451.1 glycosyltransferase family 4 protein [Clostridium tertium]MDB1951718.1 glycosyltransferase family 4 protein [Clostridium tertium]